MKKSFLLVAVALLAGIYSCMAQDEETREPKGFDKSKLFFGGNFGLSFGDYTVINVSPQIGYHFNSYFAAGAGINFQYSGVKYRNNDGSAYSKASYGVAGVNVFGRVYPIRMVLLQVQPEINYTWGKNKYYNTTLPDQNITGKYVPSFLVGGGIALPSGRGAFIAMVQYDILHDARSPYGTRPIYNFGYNVGF